MFPAEKSEGKTRALQECPNWYSRAVDGSARALGKIEWVQERSSDRLNIMRVIKDTTCRLFASGTHSANGPSHRNAYALTLF